MYITCMGSLHKLHAAGPGPRDQEAFDALLNMFVESGENWMKCELVTQNKSLREHSRTGSWALMSQVVARINSNH